MPEADKRSESKGSSVATCHSKSARRWNSLFAIRFTVERNVSDTPVRSRESSSLRLSQLWNLAMTRTTTRHALRYHRQFARSEFSDPRRHFETAASRSVVSTRSKSALSPREYSVVASRQTKLVLKLHCERMGRYETALVAPRGDIGHCPWIAEMIEDLDRTKSPTALELEVSQWPKRETDPCPTVERRVVEDFLACTCPQALRPLVHIFRRGKTMPEGSSSGHARMVSRLSVQADWRGSWESVHGDPSSPRISSDFPLARA
jgi:hypothetical protein